MIACAWVEPLTGTMRNTCDNAEEVPVMKMRQLAVSWSWGGHSRERIGCQQTHLYRKTNDLNACS
jgi:hypothetical protein